MRPRSTSPQHRVGRTVAWVAVGVVLVVSGWLAAQLFVSPAQREATALPPSPGIVTATVEQGELADTTTAVGIFAPSDEVAVPLLFDATPAVVTKAPLVTGSALESGMVLLEVNGRPLIGMAGAFIFYRDISMGDTGPDVTQLQQALADLGYAVSVDGTCGPRTAQAVKSLYSSLGYLAPGAQEPQSAGGITVPAPDHMTGSADVVLARDEVVILTKPGLRLASSPSLGTILAPESTLTFTSPNLVVRAQASEMVTGFVSLESEVSISVAGVDASGLVSTLNEGADGMWVLEIAPSTEPFDPAWVGLDALVTMRLVKAPASSLIIPTAALITQGSNRTVVVKVMPDGALREVPVTEIAELSGRSAVIAEEGGLLVGDVVRLGA